MLVEEDDRIAAEVDEVLRHAFALDDELHALSMRSAQLGGQTWAQGRLQRSRAVYRRLTTPVRLAGAVARDADLRWSAPAGVAALLAALQEDAEAQR